MLTLLFATYGALQSSWVQTKITRRIAGNLSKQLNTNISVGKVDYKFFNRLSLEDVLIEDQNRDTLLYSQQISARLDSLNIKDKQIALDILFFKNNISKLKKDSAEVHNFSFLREAFTREVNNDSLGFWRIYCKDFDFKNVSLSYENSLSKRNQHFYASELDVDVADFNIYDDSLSFVLNDLSFKGGKQLVLEKANADVQIHERKIKVSGLSAQTSLSKLQSTSLELVLYSESDSINRSFDLDLKLEGSIIDFKELGRLIPSFDGMDQKVELAGNIYGNLNDLKGKDIQLRTGETTNATIDFYINDLIDPENMYLFVDLKKSETSFSDISSFKFPNSAEQQYLYFPESFYDAGLLKFKGNFSGFLSDFVTFGTLESEMGILETDILVVPEQNGNLYYRGNVSTTNFDLGGLLKQNVWGKLTFSGSADGNYDNNSGSISGVFKGDIQSIDVNNYEYKNIEFDGILLDKMFDGLLAINDPNLQFSFLGELDLNNVVPQFDFTLNLKKALPGNLNLSELFPASEVAFNMNANFIGDKIDNLIGNIRIKDGFYKNRNGELNLTGLELDARPGPNGDKLIFKSDFFDAEIAGKYRFRYLFEDLEAIIRHYVPAYATRKKTLDQFYNSFTYSIECKNINPVADLFVPGLEFEKSFILYGDVMAENNTISLTGSIPGIKYENYWARNIFIGNKSLDQHFSSKFRIGELYNRNGFRLYNFSVDSKVNNNILENVISWSNFDELTYSGFVKTQSTFSQNDSTGQQEVLISGLPSKIYVADTLWTIYPFTLFIDSSTIDVSNFEMRHKEQSLAINGRMDMRSDEMIRIDVAQLNLSYLDKYLKKDINLEGLLSGTFGIANIFEEPVFLSDLNLNGLHYRKQFMGDVSLTSQWNGEQSAIDSELKVMRNGKQNLRAFGNYKPANGNLNYDIDVDSLSVVILETFMNRQFSDFKGHASGNVKLEGALDNLLLNGALYGDSAGLTVKVTQIPYWFSDSVYFNNDTILFDDITFFDDEYNSGKFDGTIVHENFKNMKFDLSFSSEKIRALNTTSRDNEQFYGTILADGKLDIVGADKSTQLIGSATTLRETDVKISMESESEIQQFDFIEFVSNEQTEENDFFTQAKKDRRGEFDLNFTIEATPEAKVQLIYNSQIGDVIKAQGEGILLFEMNEKGEMSLHGNYNPTKGDYLFTLQSVLNKRFTIEQGGSIVWSGDPFNADIDLRAVYKLKASLYDLLFDRFDYKNQSQRIPVECIIVLEDELINPTIGFDINFPNTEERVKDDLRPFFNTEEEMNKQILSLIVLGKFYTPEYLRGAYEAQNASMVGTTASEVMSNQLSNWLSQINSNWDVGFNYRPGNQITDDEIEVALSTQIFNDRVSLNGNIGNNTNEFSNSSSQIVGDFEMSVKLVPSGKIQFKAYNRSNDNLYYETAPYTQGIGLSFKEEYNSLEELFQKLGSLFKKKK